LGKTGRLKFAKIATPTWRSAKVARLRGSSKLPLGSRSRLRRRVAFCHQNGEAVHHSGAIALRVFGEQICVMLAFFRRAKVFAQRENLQDSS